jgi:hypothetical protein
MAAATDVRSGGLVTSTAAEIQLNLVGVIEGTVQNVLCEWVSGSFKLGVYENTTVLSPLIDSGQASLTAAGDKMILTVENGKFNLRCVGVGTFRVSF